MATSFGSNKVSERFKNQVIRISETHGEQVTVIAPTQTLSSDYGSVITDSGLSGTTEYAIIQPESLKRIQMAEGRILIGDLFAIFRPDSVVSASSLVQRGTNLYKVKNLQEHRNGGIVTHYESNLEFVRVTS